MSNETIFITQLASILAFIVTLFGLYRVLVHQKDATIELLREQVAILKDQLSDARQESPDIVAKRLSDRVNLLTEELARLHQDKTTDEAKINAKETELNAAKQKLSDLKEQLEYAQEIAEEYFCPKCKSPMINREFHSELVEYGGRDMEVDHEFTSFECGLSISDGDEVSPCTSKPVTVLKVGTLPITEAVIWRRSEYCRYMFDRRMRHNPFGVVRLRNSNPRVAARRGNPGLSYITASRYKSSSDLIGLCLSCCGVNDKLKVIGHQLPHHKLLSLYCSTKL
jgi:hypothetical protein